MGCIALYHWLHRIARFPQNRRRGTSARPPRRPLHLECLEVRCLPSTVTNLNDSGPGSLRDAIATTPDGGTVDFQPGLTGTIALTRELVITEDLTIAGPGVGVITLSPLTGLHSGVLFIEPTTANVTISGLTIANGDSFDGGGILNQGTLAVSDCILSNNKVAVGSGGEYGGGISNNGTLTVSDSVLSGNEAQYGGGIANRGGRVTITRSILDSNSITGDVSIAGGGGIYNSGILTITDSIFSGNSSTAPGSVPRGTTYSYGGGIDNAGTVTVAGSTFSGNSVNASNGNGSSSSMGGAIYNGGQLTISESTFSGNHASASMHDGISSNSSGVGIYNANVLTLISTTLTGNTVTVSGSSSGGGILTASGGMTTSKNVIIAGNDAQTGPDVSGTLTSQGHNLIGIGDGGGYSDSDLVGTAAEPINPLLGPLQDNGGPTPTISPLPGSPAIDAGDNADAPDWDQRGPGFPRIVNGTIDIGALEVQNPIPVTNTHDDGPGSLRQAIREANADPNPARITFDIAGAGIHVIRPRSPLPAVTHPVSLDGTSQPGYAGTPLIEINGRRAGPEADGLVITAGASIVMGLVIDGFAGAGIHLEGAGGNHLTGNDLGTNAAGTRAKGNGMGIFLDDSSDNTIGGLTAAAGNLIAGNLRQGVIITGSGNFVEGNRIGTDRSGTQALPNGTGVLISAAGSKNIIGGMPSGAGNLIAGNRQEGVGVAGGTGNQVWGNLIGTATGGTTPLPNGVGIELFAGSFATRVGGTETGAGNVIAGNEGDGVLIASAGNVLQGNWIGTDRGGTHPLGNGGAGVAIRAGAANLIGGTDPGASNLIADNGRQGVLVDRGAGNAIRQNSILANGRPGIKLRHGGNQGEAAPVLISAYSEFSLVIGGRLAGAPDTLFTIEFFANPDSQAGEGVLFLGSEAVMTDGSGQASFTMTLGVPANGVPFVTATATDQAGNTSAFSAGLAVTPELTRIEVPGARETLAYGINNSGQIVGEYYDAAGGRHGFLLSDGSYTTLDVPGARVTIAHGINDTGQIVGYYFDATGTHGFLLSGGNFTTFDVPGAEGAWGYGINNSGQIVGEYYDAAGDHGFLLSDGNYTTFDVPGASITAAYGINDSGQIVGTYRDTGNYRHGFLVNDGQYTTFNVPASSDTDAQGINDAGQIVGYYADLGGNSGGGFLLSGDSYTTFHVPGMVFTYAQGVNDSDQIVGYPVGGYSFFSNVPPTIPSPSADPRFLLSKQPWIAVADAAGIQVDAPAAPVRRPIRATDGTPPRHLAVPVAPFSAGDAARPEQAAALPSVRGVVRKTIQRDRFFVELGRGTLPEDLATDWRPLF